MRQLFSDKYWHRSLRYGGFWGWFWARDNNLWIALNEGGEEFAFNFVLHRGWLPVGIYFSVHLISKYWLRFHRLPKLI